MFIAEKNVEKVDRIMQKVINSIDEELIQAWIETLNIKTKHLKKKDEQKIIDLIVKYKVVWVRLQAAKSNKYTVKFIVKRAAVQAKLRLMVPELLKELETQINGQKWYFITY